MVDFLAAVISLALIAGLLSPFVFAAYVYIKSK